MAECDLEFLVNTEGSYPKISGFFFFVLFLTLKTGIYFLHQIQMFQISKGWNRRAGLQSKAKKIDPKMI